GYAARPSFRYPWEGLEQELARDGRGSLPLVGYGSLVELDSAARTLGPASLRTARSIVCFGVRRVFEYDKTAGRPRAGQAADDPARAALNARVTGEPADALNGLLFDMERDDVHAMREREIGYDLVPTACFAWDALDLPAMPAWVLSAPDEPRVGSVFVDPDLTPDVEYFARCRDGAAALGEPFLRFWRETTFLADGVTPIAAWESRQAAGTSD
ncbi:MAG: hypothetical protein ACYTCU_06190, partial [Planctomycetota bacterium]